MAKKNKKRSTSSSARVVKNSTAATPTAAATTTTANPKGAVAYGSSEFNPDYSYVRKDLKRIGTLAGSFFVILVVLSFFLR